MKLSYQIDMAPESEWLVVSAEPENKEHLPYVQELGDFIAHEKYFTTREGLPSYLIKYTLSGEGRLLYKGQDEYLPPGCFYWIDCQNHQHYHTSERTRQWRVLWVHFYGGESTYLYQKFLSANGGNIGRLPANSTIVPNLYALLDLYRNASASGADVRAAALLLQIMAECIDSAECKQDDLQSRYVRQIQDYICAHYRERITLDVLANEISLNKFYLQKLFLQRTGQSPGEFLTGIRVNHAKELLRMTQKSVSAVALETGIENTSYFIRVFKTRENVTPAEFRRIWHTGSAVK